MCILDLNKYSLARFFLRYPLPQAQPNPVGSSSSNIHPTIIPVVPNHMPLAMEMNIHSSFPQKHTPFGPHPSMLRPLREGIE